MGIMGITATQAAKQIGCSVATVSRWVDRLHLGEKYGSSLVLKPSEVNKIKHEWKKAKGRPKDSENSGR